MVMVAHPLAKLKRDGNAAEAQLLEEIPAQKFAEMA